MQLLFQLRISILAAALVLAVAAIGPAHAQRRMPPPSKEAVQYSFAPIVKQTAPAVVNVYVRSRVQSFTSPFADDPFFRQFFGNRLGQPTERQQNSLGSGVIVRPTASSSPTRTSSRAAARPRSRSCSPTSASSTPR